jgi:uncharacterized repeat protein (TIGR01451 family)
MMIAMRFLGLLLSCWFLAIPPVQAQQHRAVHLGHPLTRFAPPLQTPEDLRRVFLQGKLQQDIDAIARMSGYRGDMEDFRRAVASAPINVIRIPPGTRLPAMSTRRHGRPVLLFDVLWAGKAPFEAYEFFFNSLGRRYRVVVPKPCSNFWLEEQPLPHLSLSCKAPEEAILGRPFTVCNRVENSGTGTEGNAVLSLAIPADMVFMSGTAGANPEAERVNWLLQDVAPGAVQERCATFSPRQRGLFAFSAALAGDLSPSTGQQCQTHVHGIPAVLLEVVDLKDPVMVGGEVTYEIRVRNQGTEPITRIQLAGTLEDSQRFLSGSGATEVLGADNFFNPRPLERLEPQQEARWRIIVRAEKAGDTRFRVELRADQFERPVLETEATMQY